MAQTKLSPQVRYNLERQAMDAFAKRSVDAEELTKALFQSTAERVGKQIDELYIRYGSAQGLSAKDMRKLADRMEITKFQDAARLAVQNRDFSPETNKWLKTYNLKMRASRLELAKAQIELELLTTYSDFENLMASHMHFEAMTEYKRQAGILGNSVGNVPDRITSIVNADFYGNNFSQKIWDRTGHFANTRKEVFKVMTEIFTDMDGFKKQRRYLMERMKVSSYEATRLIKTEMARVNADTRLAMYEEEGFTHYQYIAEFGACEICADLDGMVYEKGEAQSGYNYPILHPNCRCSTLGIVNLKRRDGTEIIEDYINGYENQYSNIHGMR